MFINKNYIRCGAENDLKDKPRYEG